MPTPVPSVARLRLEARTCTACPLWRSATQTVFGEGDPRAAVMLVGEQPGNAEDLAGRPFVGPAGKLLERAMAEAGLSREAAYVTNVVKHFKWELRGKRRLHKSPAQKEIDACRPWLEAEMAAVGPALIVCLGVTATHALVPGRPVLADLRGRILPSSGGRPALLATVHPSYVLRLRSERRSRAFAGLVADLAVAARFLKARSGTPASSASR